MTTPAPSDDRVREAFEEFMPLWRPKADLARNSRGRYTSIAVRHQWEVWQAAFQAGAADWQQRR